MLFKVKHVIKCDAEQFGILTVGTGIPSMTMGSWMLTSFEKVVNSVSNDLDGDNCRFLEENLSFSIPRYRLRSLHIGGTVGPEHNTLLSSAYVTSLMLSGGMGSLDMYRFNNSGDKTPTCGTSWFIFLSLDFAPLNSTYCILPLR